MAQMGVGPTGVPLRTNSSPAFGPGMMGILGGLALPVGMMAMKRRQDAAKGGLPIPTGPRPDQLAAAAPGMLPGIAPDPMAPPPDMIQRILASLGLG